MADQNNIQINIPLLPQANLQDQILLVDKLYQKAFNHFQLCVIMSGIYSVLKVILAPIFIGISQPYKQLQQIWLILLIPLSILHSIYYYKVFKFARNKQIFLQIANQVNHAAYFTTEHVSQNARQTHVHDNIANFRNPAITEVIDKQVKILSLEIKYDVIKQDWKIMLVSRTLFALYTAMHVWGYIIFINSDTPNAADYFIIVVFFIGTYQYLELYLGIVGLIIVLPFFLVYLAAKAIKKHRKNKRIARMLQGVKYNSLTLRGQHSCHICMDDYHQNDILTVLPCNQMHHFHQKCLVQWIKVSGTCPLCRVQIQGPQ